MSANVSLAQIYRGGLDRITELNWIDPQRTGTPPPFNRDPFARPTAAELARAWGGNNMGGVRLVNLLNPAQTGFPPLSLDELKELSGGPYLLNLARSYMTSYRVNVMQNQPYVNLNHFHNSRSQANGFMLGYMFDQQLPPANWYGVWPGCQTPNTKLWEPVRFLTLPRLPSRYRSQADHTIVIAFVPEGLPVLPFTGSRCFAVVLGILSQPNSTSTLGMQSRPASFLPSTNHHKSTELTS